MNKVTVIDLAREMERATIQLESLASQNRSTDVIQRVEQQAEYQIAMSKQFQAKQAYDTAFRAWADEGYPE